MPSTSPHPPTLSLPLRLMFGPFRVYRERGEELASERAETAEWRVGGRAAASAAARLLFVIGVFVAITATGRLAPLETLLGAFAFAWIPLLHGAAVAMTTRLLAPKARPLEAVALYFEGAGPWLVVFVVISGSCLFAPQPARPVFILLGPMILVGAIWSLVLQVALFHAGLGLPRVRAALATALVQVLATALVLFYFLAAGQLWPIL